MSAPKPIGKSKPIIGGVLTFVLFGVHRLFVGQIYSRSEAMKLVDSLSDLVALFWLRHCQCIRDDSGPHAHHAWHDAQ